MPRSARSTGIGLRAVAIAVFGLLNIATPLSAQPTRQQVRDVVRAVLGKQVDSETCAAKKSGADYVIECHKTECKSCNVTYVYTTLVRKDGKWRVGSTRRQRQGDTGECGCCQLAQ
jgi:hypothetical protein